jgi:hypothetical protein
MMDRSRAESLGDQSCNSERRGDPQRYEKGVCAVEFIRKGQIRARRPRDYAPTSQDGDARSDLTYVPYSDTARTVRPLVRLWGVSKSIRCPGDRPIKAAPTGVRTEIRLSSMFASCG